MVNQINGSDNFPSLPSHMDLEFLEVLLQPEDATYPWNPVNEESEAYFLQLEQQFALQDVLEEELSVRSQDFYSQLDTFWNSLHYKCNTKSTITKELQESLQSGFANRIPQQWLQVVTQKATEIFNSQQSMAEQLVECVQALLPTWGTEDLLVLARPYAYAMRGNEPQDAESLLNSFEEKEWTNLSEIEQVRVSIAIAYHALQTIKNLEAEA